MPPRDRHHEKRKPLIGKLELGAHQLPDQGPPRHEFAGFQSQNLVRQTLGISFLCEFPSEPSVHRAKVKLCLTHPKTFFLYSLTDRAFGRRKLVLVKQRTHPFAFALKHQFSERLVQLQRLLKPVRAGQLFQKGDDLFVFARVHQRKRPVMTADVPIEQSLG